MKKLTAILVSAILVCSLAITSFADVFTPSAEAQPKPSDVTVTVDGVPASDGDIQVTTTTSSDQIIDEEEKVYFEEARDEIANLGSLLEVSIIKSNTSFKNPKTALLGNVELTGDVKLLADGTKEISVSFTAPGFGNYKKVEVYLKNPKTDEWESVNYTRNGNKFTISSVHFCPFMVVVEGDEMTSPETNDIARTSNQSSAIVMVVGIMAVAFVSIVAIKKVRN